MDKLRINIAIIEPSQIVYEGISNILLKSGGHIFIYRLTDPCELYEIGERELLRIVILNPSIIQNRIAEFNKLKSTFPDMVWMGIIYTLFDDKVINMFDGTVSVSDSTEVIIKQIEKISNPGLSKELPKDDLTDREKDVLKLMVKGLYNKEIAEELNISVHTVVSHRKNIVEKTAIKSLSGLTVFAISKKIVDMEDIS